MRLYTIPLVCAIIFPLLSVPNTPFPVRFVIVIPPAVVPSKIIPVVEVLSPLLVKKIFWIYWNAFGATTHISNAFAMKSMHDIHRKNIVAPLMKLIFLLLACKFLLVKTMILNVEYKIQNAEVFY